ncbi:MAG TPA: heparan-alpha-glucosaminide N-acetyltransferase domain-containing protein [Spirochaetota bacterium]|nr:heparan-alpha-glucosaminide N-acetyltransferase domain-containing protein [Spirochaetota bacterium]
MTGTNVQNRISSLDFLRGIAVLLMVQQHTGYWFWQSGGSIGALITKYPAMVTMNGLGGLAAPLFIALAGAGTTLSFASGKTDREIILRGILLIVFGYLLNIMTPAWFAPWSWYVLHLIGSGMCLSPLMRRVNSYLLFILALVIAASSVALLDYYGMPRYFSNSFMRGTFSAAGILKLAAFSGNFPVFPWMALFIAGMAAGRWICSDRYINILKTAGALLFIGLLLFLVKQGDFSFFNNSWGRRLLMVNLYMYPAYPVQFAALSAVTLLLIYTVLIAGKKYIFSSGNIIVLLGRVSLSIFIIHIAVIRNLMVTTGLWQSFSAGATVLLQILVIAVIMLFVCFWNRREFRYGFEWLMRKVK